MLSIFSTIGIRGIPSVVVLALHSLPVYSDTATPITSKSESYCVGLWSEIVGEIDQVLSTEQASFRVVMIAGQDGKIFNCLEQALPKTVVDELEYWSVIRSRVLSTDPLNTGRPPPNFCGSSYGRQQGYDIMTVYLPYSLEELESAECSLRLPTVLGLVEEFWFRDMKEER